MPPHLRVVGSDLTDLQAQVLARRAELQRAWDYQQAQKPVTSALAHDWPDLSSRAWDFAHETASILNASGQDDRGRALLRELEVMYARFKSEGVGPAAMPVTPPPTAPPDDPSHAAPLLSSSLSSLLGNAETLLLLVGLVWLATRKK